MVCTHTHTPTPTPWQQMHMYMLCISLSVNVQGLNQSGKICSHTNILYIYIYIYIYIYACVIYQPFLKVHTRPSESGNIRSYYIWWYYIWSYFVIWISCIIHVYHTHTHTHTHRDLACAPSFLAPLCSGAHRKAACCWARAWGRAYWRE